MQRPGVGAWQQPTGANPMSRRKSHHQRRHLLASFVAEAAASIALFDRDMRYLAASEKWRRDYGLDADPTGRSHYDVFPEISDTWKAVHRRALAGETVRAEEDRFVRHDGRVQWLNWEVRPWYDDDGETGGITVNSEEITGPKAAQQALADNLARYRALLETAVAAVVTIDATGIINSVNPVTTTMFGYSAEELIGQNVQILMPASYAAEHDGYIANYLQTGTKRIIGIGREVTARRKDGSQFPIHLAVSSFIANGEQQFAGIITDLSERRRVEEKLSASEERLHATLELAKIGLWHWDPETGTTIEIDPPYARMMGLPDNKQTLSTPEFIAMVHPDDRKRVKQAVAAAQAGGRYLVEYRVQMPDGSVRWLLDKGDYNPLGPSGRRFMRGATIDITERKVMEEALKEGERRLVHAQKLEAVGQLAGGIAHDFNNLLTVVIGNLELLEEQIEDERLRGTLRQVQDAATSGADLAQRLLGFSRQLPLDPQIVDTNELVLRTCELLRRTLGEHVNLSTALSTQLWKVRADPAQIESALTNLAINARDAMPNGGRLIVETRNVHVAADQTGDGLDLQPGDYVTLSVSDTGQGIPQEVRERVFEPFFTTKPKGRGTGLGLAMIYGFAKQSGGHVVLDSVVGKGTVVKLYLPRTQLAGSASIAPESARQDRDVASALILLVEDDALVRELNLKRLRQLGHEVVEAETGAKALELIRGGLRPDLVFSDMVMPGGVSGRDLLVEVKAIDPTIRFLLTSGYSEELTGGGSSRESTMILKKPYRLKELAEALRKALSSDERG